MQFKSWFLEELTLKNVKPPDERFKHIWVNDPNNPQQIDYWKKQNTNKEFEFPLAKDKFVHFTLKDSAPLIVESGMIQAPVYAVSLSWGVWLPVVQFDHIIRKKNDKFISISDLKNKVHKDKLLQHDWKIPHFANEIAAVVFQTSNMPTSARKEEVYWESPIRMLNAQVMPTREAIRLLKNTPYGKEMDANNDMVRYK